MTDFLPFLHHDQNPKEREKVKRSECQHEEPKAETICLLLVRYPAINKPAAVLHWLNHADTDAEFIVILDADMIMRGPITPWEYKAERGRPVSTPYE